MIKTSGIILLALSTWILWLVVSQFLLCARFQFNDPIPFEGPVIYNPYDSVRADDWAKCNFHAHSRAWEGVTNGHGTAHDVHDAYKSLNYGFHCVSNYHHIDTTHASEPGYIPAYEHGYNIRKTHQLVLGSHQVQWLDYLLPQTVHNKQHVLDNLAEDGSVIILNHPALKNGYTTQDLTLLGGYDCMEVLNPSVISTAQWDAALSAGKKVFIVGDDDIHDVIAKKRLGEMCTFVNVPKNDGFEVLKALKAGRSYGVAIGKDQAADSIPKLLKLAVKDDSIFIEMSQPAAEVVITGQNGKVLATLNDTDRVQYKLRPEDHYARTTFHYQNGTGIYLNPVFFTPKSGYRAPVIYENVNETTFYRTLGVVVLFLWLLIAWRFLPGSRGQRFGRRKLSWR